MQRSSGESHDESHARARRVELANQLFREFYAACFWHMKRDLTVTEEMIPRIIKGLRTHGGRRGMLAAAQLLQGEEMGPILDQTIGPDDPFYSLGTMAEPGGKPITNQKIDKIVYRE